MKITAINDMLSTLAMIVTDVNTIDQIASAIDEVDKYKEKIKSSLGEFIALHFEILALKILDSKIK